MSVTSLASSSVTWSKIGEYTEEINGTIPYTLSIFYAPLAAGAGTTYSSTTVTIDFNNTPDDYGVIFFGVTGLYSYTSPLDSNVLLPIMGYVAGTGDLSTDVSTSQADDLLLAFSMTAGGGGTYPPSYTGIGYGGGWPNNNWVGLAASYLSISTLQSSVSVDWGTVTATLGVILAISADAPPSPGETGTWASTEAPDTMSMAGDLPISGTWASTEAADTMILDGYPGAGGSITGTWASTEEVDTLTMTGYASGSESFVPGSAGHRRIFIMT
jgi:hypothetical protein